MSFSRVVLPHPLGPSTTIVWPSGTRRVKSRIATVDLRPPPQIPEDSLSVLQTSRRSICATGTPRPVGQACDNVAWNTIVANRPQSRARVCDLRPLLRWCPTCRDFVPWRFLDAGQLSARVFRNCRRPKTSTGAEVESTFGCRVWIVSLVGLPKSFRFFQRPSCHGRLSII